MKNQNTSFYHLVLDKSGSMTSHYAQTLEALNEKLMSLKEIQKRNPEVPIKVSLSLFSDVQELVIEDKDADQLEQLSEQDYTISGLTALIDAIGLAVSRMEREHGGAIQAGEASATIVIFTDGHENASKEYKSQDIADKIKQLEANGNWSFVFVGADIDAWQSASQLSFHQSNVYSSKKEHVKETMHMLASNFERSIKGSKKKKSWFGFFK
jgi:uncharacterized protein YegL